MKLKSEKQYKVTLDQLEKFRDSLLEVDERGQGDKHPKLQQMQVDAIKSVITDLEGEAKEWEQAEQ